MQLLLSGYTSEAYLAEKAWESATLSACPLHRGRSCGLAGHGSYARVTPAGIRVARYRCPKARTTFSLLPEFLSSRMPGLLDDVERVVLAVESARSIEAAADDLRPDIELPGAVRWVRRRLVPVRTVLLALVTMLPELLECVPRMHAVRERLRSMQALRALRQLARAHLPALRHPFGLLAPPPRGRPPGGARQHETGPDPGR